ncbi:hypothetical protein Hanom_Chr04g00328721 [Helianthus anomalus]
MMVESFKGTQVYQAVDDQLLNLVDNLEAWNQFPWGIYLWPNTCTKVYNLNQRYQPENKGFSLPGCVWHSRLAWNSMNRIIQDSTMIDEYFPSCNLFPTSEESDTMWFGSSLQHIVSFGLMKPASEKMQPSSE